jgi:tetratricopeptide (TPR) repeat protein
MEKDTVLDELESLLRFSERSEDLIHVGRFREGKISVENLSVLLAHYGEKQAPPDTATREKPLRNLIEELEREMGLSVPSAQKEIEPLLKEFQKKSQKVLGQDAQARIDMAVAYFEMGLFKEAEQELQTIAETDPLFAQALVLQGEIFLSQGSDLAALDCFQKSLRQTAVGLEVQREARYQLVQVFFRLGDLPQAFAQATELEKQAPNYRELRYLKNQIQDALEKQMGRRA